MAKINFEKVTTREGDKSESSLSDGRKYRKDSLIFQTIGNLDELFSYLGIVRANLKRESEERGSHKDYDSEYIKDPIQKNIININSLVATSPETQMYENLTKITEAKIESLEKKDKELESEVEIESRFYIPGENIISTHIEYARAITRRCERYIVSLIKDSEYKRDDLDKSQSYLNRLSDFLFFLARKHEK